MAGTRLHNVYWSAVLLLTLVAGLAARVEAQSKGTLRLNVKDYVGVSPVRLADTNETATAIYTAAGVEVGWTYRCFRGCGGQVEVARESSSEEAIDLTIFIYPDAMTLTTLPASSKSVMGSAPGGSSVAYAFFDRVIGFAFKRNLLVGTVLGHVIAHEVGHLLLREGHAERGLMRAEWFKRDLELAKTGLLGFTPEQGSRIREQLGRAISCCN
jgi:hypothetical protein